MAWFGLWCLMPPSTLFQLQINVRVTCHFKRVLIDLKS